LEFLSSFFFVVLYINLSAKAKESLILNFKDMPKEQGTLAQVLSVQEQLIGREESETSHQELPLNFPNQQTTSCHESSVSAGFDGVADPCSSETTTEKAPSSSNIKTSPRYNLSATINY
jgi:hypothetical protein